MRSQGGGLYLGAPVDVRMATEMRKQIYLSAKANY